MLRKILTALVAALTLASPAAAQNVLTPSWVAVYGGKATVAAPATLALIASVNTTFPAATTDSGCWSGEWRTGTPSVSNPDGGTPTLIPVIDSGYDTSGNATTYTHNRVVTSRVRSVYPSATTPTAATVSLDNYVYPTSTISGVDTSGCDRAPTPVMNWATPHRQTVGNTLPGMEVLGFSRDAQGGQELAAVQCSATDGTLTVTGTVSAMTVSSRPDVNPVIDYKCPDLDITTLAAGLITYNVKGYPWYGGSASVADSSTATVSSNNLRLFTPRYFWKDTSNPVLVYLCQQAVASSCPGAGNDTTCVVSATRSTAVATPCLTFQGAMNKLKASAVDNAQIVVSSNTGTPFASAGPTTGAMTQNGGCLVVTRDPQVTRAQAVLSFGDSSGPAITTVTNPTSTGCIRFYDLTMKRTAGNSISGNDTHPLEIIWDQVNLDDGSFTGSWFRAANRADDYIFNATVTNPGANFLSASSTGNHRILRGLNIVSPGNLEVTTVIGSTFDGSTGLLDPNTLTADGSIIAFTQFRKTTASGFGNIGTTVASGAARVQNVWEDISATGSVTFATVSNDSQTNPTSNVILQYNTVAAAEIAGRSNLFYDDGATERVNKLQDCRGNLYGQINTKGDVFDSDGTRTGNWAFLYGVGCQGQFSQYNDANGTTLTNGVKAFAQAYGGLSAKIGTSNTTAQMAVTKFTNYQAVTCVTPCATFTAGAGGGDYSLTTGALVKAMVPIAALPFDLAGVARPTTADTAGAYVAP